MRELQGSDAIEENRVAKLKEINAKRDQINTVSIRIHELERELLELKESRRVAKHILALLITDEKILQSEFWQSKT